MIGLTNLITQSFSDFSWLPSVDLGDNEIEGDGKRVEGWTVVVVKPRWVFDGWQYLYMVTTNVLINALQETHCRQKQLKSNNFIRNTYCKIYFSFIVGNILHSHLILTPPPVLALNVGSYHSLSSLPSLWCRDGSSFYSGSPGPGPTCESWR